MGGVGLFGKGLKASVGQHGDGAGVFFGVQGVFELPLAGEVLVKPIDDVFGDDALGGFEGGVEDGLAVGVEFDRDGSVAHGVNVEGVGGR